MLSPRGVSIFQAEISATTCCLHEAFFTHITLFTGTTRDCATALFVVGPSPQGVSQLRYRLQLCCLREAFSYLSLRYQLQQHGRHKASPLISNCLFPLFSGYHSELFNCHFLFVCFLMHTTLLEVATTTNSDCFTGHCGPYDTQGAVT